MLTPSFFYESHIAHHSMRHYGTEQDGEARKSKTVRAAGLWYGIPKAPEK